MQLDSHAGASTDATVGICPVAIVSMGGVEVRCLIDTGSQVSTITESCFRRYIAREDVDLESCGWLKLTAANGLSIPYVGYVELDVTCMGRTIPRRGILIVCDSPDAEQRAHKEKCPGVLGMNVLGEFNMALSHDERSTILGNCSSAGMVASVNEANRRDRKGFVRVVASQSLRIPGESCTTLRVSGCSQHADDTWVVVEPITGALPADVSVCSTLARVRKGVIPVQVVNTGREDVWLKPRTRIGVYQTVVHVSEEDNVKFNVCFHAINIGSWRSFFASTMVFLTFVNLMRYNSVRSTNRGPDKFWRVQQFLRFTWRFRGRKRNCYRIGMRYIFKSLQNARLGRILKKSNQRELWMLRLDAAAREHGLGNTDFLEGLARCQIQLDRKVLTDIAIYEPRTFQSLVEIAKKRLEEDGLGSATTSPPKGVFTRGML